MKGYRAARNPWLLVVLLIICGLIGSLVGTLLQVLLPILGYGFPAIGLSPITIDLLVLSITFGLVLKLNLASIIGFIVGIIIYFRT